MGGGQVPTKHGEDGVMKKRILGVLLGAAVFVGATAPSALAWTAPNGTKCTDHDGGVCSSSGPGVPPGHSHNPNPGK
jgi:hypothetical protein